MRLARCASARSSLRSDSVSARYCSTSGCPVWSRAPRCSSVRASPSLSLGPRSSPLYARLSGDDAGFASGMIATSQHVGAVIVLAAGAWFSAAVLPETREKPRYPLGLRRGSSRVRRRVRVHFSRPAPGRPHVARSCPVIGGGGPAGAHLPVLPYKSIGGEQTYTTPRRRSILRDTVTQPPASQAARSATVDAQLQAAPPPRHSR